MFDVLLCSYCCQRNLPTRTTWQHACIALYPQLPAASLFSPWSTQPHNTHTTFLQNIQHTAANLQSGLSFMHYIQPLSHAEVKWDSSHSTWNCNGCGAEAAATANIEQREIWTIHLAALLNTRRSGKKIPRHHFVLLPQCKKGFRPSYFQFLIFAVTTATSPTQPHSRYGFITVDRWVQLCMKQPTTNKLCKNMILHNIVNDNLSW